MDEHKVTLDTVEPFMRAIAKRLHDGETLKVKVTRWTKARSLNQNAMFHKHMGELSAYLIGRGRSHCTPEWCKYEIKYNFLGTEAIQRVNLKTGEVTEVQEVRHSSGLEVGEMTDFITRYLAWCCDIGCHLSLPEDSEYMKLLEQGGY